MPLSTAWRDRARALAEGRLRPAPVRDAATVALVRDGPDGLEVHLLRRTRGMAFAGGMHVFPGGAVDAGDVGPEGQPAEGDAVWSGTAPSVWARAFGCDVDLARALVRAAVRETFEETGVLLAGPAHDRVLDDVGTDEWEAERAALEARRQSLSGLLARRGLVLRADLLAPLAHWITPEVELRRYDTRFFLARLPSGQRCREVGTEADDRRWVRPGEALRQGLAMLPPTEAVLRELATCPDVAAALAAQRTIRPVRPRVVVDDAGDARFVDG